MSSAAAKPSPAPARTRSTPRRTADAATATPILSHSSNPPPPRSAALTSTTITTTSSSSSSAAAGAPPSARPSASLSAAAAAAGGSAASSSSSSPPVFVSPAVIESAFSFLPDISSLLQALQRGKDGKQAAQATESLLSHIAAAQSLLSSLPAVTVSAAEQQQLLQRLEAVRDKKRALAARYRLLPAAASVVAGVAGADAAATEQCAVREKSEEQPQQRGDGMQAMQVDG